MGTTWLKIGSEKNVLRGLTNFTSSAGINNGAIILSPGMRSGVSMFTFKGVANGFNLGIS
jgi:hypothetical protein